MGEVKLLDTRLVAFWKRFADCFAMTAREAIQALDVLSGLLRMTTERKFNNLDRTAGANQQNIQHFMSHSTWETQDVLLEIHREIADLPRFQKWTWVNDQLFIPEARFNRYSIQEDVLTTNGHQ